MAGLTPRWSWTLLALITLLALVLRIDRIDAESLWLDEVSSWRATQASWPTFVETVLIGECTPPLYFALLKVWTCILGDSTLMMRLPSVVLGTLTVPLLGWFVGRLAGPGPACLAALLLAVAPFAIDFCHDARPYALFPFLVLAATMALSWALESKNIRRWGVYTVFALLACYTHYFTVFFLAAQGTFILLFCGQKREWRPLRDWSLAMTAVGVCYLPWMPFLLRSNLQSVQWLQSYARQWPPLMQLWVTMKSLIFGRTYPLPLGDSYADLVLVLTPLAVLLGYRRNQNASSIAAGWGKDQYAFALLGVMTVAPLLFAWTFSQFRPSLMHRYVIPIVPAAMGLMALAICRLPWLSLRIAIGVTLVGYFVMCWHNQRANPTQPELRLAAAHIAANMKPGDAIVIQAWHYNLVLSYFLRERMLPVVNDYGWPAEPDEVMLRTALTPFQRVWYLRVDSQPCAIETYLDAHYSQAAAPEAFFRIPVLKLYTVRR